MLVVHEDRCLLGRQPGWMTGMSVAEAKAAFGEAGADRPLAQFKRGIDIEAGAFRPAMWFEIPVDRHAGMPLFDPGIAVDLGQALERLGARREQTRGLERDRLLVEDMAGNGGGERAQAGFHGERPSDVVRGPLPMPPHHPTG